MCLLHPQKAEEEALAQEQSRQRALDAERERVAEMQRRQQEQEQFSAFEEMIRRQELEKERQRLLLEFATPAMPSPDTPLIPGIQGPSIVSPAALQSPGGLPGGTNHQFNRPAANTGPPVFDRSLKPGSVLSPGNNSELIFFLIRVGAAFRGFKRCSTLASKYLFFWADFFPPLTYFLSVRGGCDYLSTPCLSKTSRESYFCIQVLFTPLHGLCRYNGGCPSAAGSACWAVPELPEAGRSQHQPGCGDLWHPLWQTGKTPEQSGTAELSLNRSVTGSWNICLNEMLVKAFIVPSAKAWNWNGWPP